MFLLFCFYDLEKTRIKSSQHDRIAEYVNAWAWKARRTGDYFFQVLAREPAP